MLRCIAIDDEPLALELLADNISKVPFLKLEGECGNPMEAMKILQMQQVDLIFLDIQMPGLTGLQFIKSLSQKPMFILITAYEKYALEGFELDVVDYLVKPVPFERFLKACNKAYELHQLRLKPSAEPADYFFVNVDYTQFKVVFSDIQFIEGLKDYIKIHLKSNPKPVITRMSMKALEEALPNSFIRIHKSYIVSIHAITAIKKTSVFIGAQEFPIGETYQDEVSRLTGRV